MSVYDRIVDLVRVYFSQEPVLGAYVKTNFKPNGVGMYSILLKHSCEKSPIQSSLYVYADKLILHAPQWQANCCQTPSKFEIWTENAPNNSYTRVITSDDDVMQFLRECFPIQQQEAVSRNDLLGLMNRVDALLNKMQSRRNKC